MSAITITPTEAFFAFFLVLHATISFLYAFSSDIPMIKIFYIILGLGIVTCIFLLLFGVFSIKSNLSFEITSFIIGLALAAISIGGIFLFMTRKDSMQYDTVSYSWPLIVSIITIVIAIQFVFGGIQFETKKD